MIKVNVMHPYTEGARFDHAYYRKRHMSMVKSRLGNRAARRRNAQALRRNRLG